MIDARIDTLPKGPPPTVREATKHGRHVLSLYAGVLERHKTAVFNTSDIRVLCGALDDLIRARGRRNVD